MAYSICLEDGIENYYIPKLCIQLVVENAVVHVLEPKHDKSKAEVVITKEKDHKSIVVNDDGVGVETEGEGVLPLKIKRCAILIIGRT